MTKLLIGFLLATGLAACSPAPAGPEANASNAAENRAQAANLPDADPAMWVVKDEDTTIYLFGTFHLLDDRPWFNDEIKAAFDESQELVLEVLMPEDMAAQVALARPLVSRYGTAETGRTVSSRLTHDEMQRLSGQLGVPADALDRYDPWLLTQGVAAKLGGAPIAALGLTPTKGGETVLGRAAKARNMPQSALETAEFQIRMFDSLPEDVQIVDLKAVIADPAYHSRRIPPLLDAWSRGDDEDLGRLNMAALPDPRMYDVMFIARNATWARWIDERMKRPGVVFMAVGAGHLVGRGSVQEHLRRLNIRSQRVPAGKRN